MFQQIKQLTKLIEESSTDNNTKLLEVVSDSTT